MELINFETNEKIMMNLAIQNQMAVFEHNRIKFCCVFLV